jgi:hypothetical protein
MIKNMGMGSSNFGMEKYLKDSFRTESHMGEGS